MANPVEEFWTSITFDVDSVFLCTHIIYVSNYQTVDLSPINKNKISDKHLETSHSL